MADGMANGVGMWLRWAALDGIPRAALAVQARRKDPLARLLIGPQRGGDPNMLSEQIRAKGRLIRTPFAWVTADHELARTILRDNDFKVTNPANMNLPAPVTWLIRHTDPQLPHPAEPPSMLQVDPPEHSRYRHPVAHAFTPRAIDKLRTRIIEVTGELLDRLATSPHPDMIADYAAPLPAEIIAEILGIPRERRAGLLDRGDSGAPLLDIGVSWKTYRRGIRVLRDSAREIGERIDHLRAEPGDDVFSQVIRDGDLNDHELATTAALLAGAGFETTVNLIGNAIVLLVQHPEQLGLLKDNPDLWPNAVEEVLRLAAPVQMTSRTTTCDLELGDENLRAHETVALLLAGANRDPATFTAPDTFDITRTNSKEHLSFSSGVHACLGASLARMEATIALQALFERFPSLQLDGTPTRRQLATLNGYGRIPVKLKGFDPGAFRIVLFDQRGCGDSRPHASDPATDMAHNTTEHLLADMETLREHLGIDRWLLYGGSWASTLILAYAQRHPDRVIGIVLIGVTMTRPQEIDWLYGGLRLLFPVEWERFRAGVPERDRDGNLVEAYRQLMESSDIAVRERAARDWCVWEDAVIAHETLGNLGQYGVDVVICSGPGR